MGFYLETKLHGILCWWVANMKDSGNTQIIIIPISNTSMWCTESWVLYHKKWDRLDINWVTLEVPSLMFYWKKLAFPALWAEKKIIFQPCHYFWYDIPAIENAVYGYSYFNGQHFVPKEVIFRTLLFWLIFWLPGWLLCKEHTFKVLELNDARLLSCARLKFDIKCKIWYNFLVSWCSI